MIDPCQVDHLNEKQKKFVASHHLYDIWIDYADRMIQSKDNPYSGIVYYVSSECLRFVKIGITKNPSSRMRSLRRIDGFMGCTFCKNPRKLEIGLHHALSPYQVKIGNCREWFCMRNFLKFYYTEMGDKLNNDYELFFEKNDSPFTLDFELARLKIESLSDHLRDPLFKSA